MTRKEAVVKRFRNVSCYDWNVEVDGAVRRQRLSASLPSLPLPSFVAIADSWTVDNVSIRFMEM
jgi:hypothetical protein